MIGHVYDTATPLDDAPAAMLEALRTATLLVVSVAPGSMNDPVLAALGENGLERFAPGLEWIAYLSTVGVYGDHGGAWVDEETGLRPVSARSVERVAAERQWQSAASEAGVPLAILRLSGIYGPGRNALVNAVEGKARRLVKPGQVFNRIHVADIAGATVMLGQGRIGGIFNVTDSEPAPPQDVVTFACELAGIEPPPEQDFETADLSPMARSFYGENKRVSNARIQEAGFRFLYPDYRTALLAMWTGGDWKG